MYRSFFYEQVCAGDHHYILDSRSPYQLPLLYVKGDILGTVIYCDDCYAVHDELPGNWVLA